MYGILVVEDYHCIGDHEIAVIVAAVEKLQGPRMVYH